MDPQKDLTPEQGTEQPQVEAQTPQEQPAIDPAPAQQQPPVDPENDPNSVDFWKKKATAQGQENIILSKRLEEATRPKELTKEPTDSDLQAAFPEWEIMTDTEKRLARETFTAKRIASSLQQKENQREAERQWMTDLELAIAKNPSLLGKEQAFKDFAKKPTHRGAPLETLVSAFLFESSSLPPSTPVPTPSAPGLLPGNGGPREAEKPKLLSATQLKTLRETDDKAYREYIATHDVSAMLDE
jgi:hypothetical protein